MSTNLPHDHGALRYFVEYTAGAGAGWAGTFGVEVTPGSQALGAKSRTDTASDANETSDDSGTYTAKAEVEDYWGIYFEPTFAVSDNVGLYLKGGVSTLTVVTLEDISSGTDSSAYGNETILGGTYGFGVTGDLGGEGAYYKIEYAKTEYEPVKFSSTSGNGTIVKADTEQEAIRLAVGYNF